MAIGVGARFRKKPVEVDAMQWLGGDTKVLDRFVGLLGWTRADARDIPWEHDDTEEVVVWNYLEKTWTPAPVGHWIIRGVMGEVYPCDPEAFERTYEPAHNGASSDPPISTPQGQL